MQISGMKSYSVNKNTDKVNASVNEADNNWEGMDNENKAQTPINSCNESVLNIDFSTYVKERLKNDIKNMNKEIESSGETFSEYGKMLETARRIANGDRVPVSDEKKLMEYNIKLYKLAKMSSVMANNKSPKKYKSLFDDEENPIEEKIKDLNSQASILKFLKAPENQEMQEIKQ